MESLAIGSFCLPLKKNEQGEKCNYRKYRSQNCNFPEDKA